MSPVQNRWESRSRPPLWVYLVVLFAVLIVAQGALRKWIFPGLSTPLYIAKDVALFGGLIAFLWRRDFRLAIPLRQTLLPILWGGLACIVVLQAFNLNVPSALVGILGIRSYLLYSVLLVLMPVALQYVERPQRLVSIVAIGVVAPILCLGMRQYTMPQGHWINQYAAEGAQVETVMGRTRITGTFSYIQAMRPFLIFSFAFGVGTLIAGIRRERRWYQIIGLVLLGLSLVVAPMNGSRGVVFGICLALPFVLYAAFQQGRRTALVLGIVLLVLVGGYIGTQTDLAVRAWETFQTRVESASDRGGNVSRIESMLWDPIDKVSIGGILGYGAGATHPGASLLAPLEALPDVGGEEELGRVIIELGVFGAAFFSSLKAWILWVVWQAMMRARTAWEDIICMTAFPVALQHLYVDKIVFNHVGGAIYWLCVGAAVWVWSRRSTPKARHSSRKPARSSL